MRSPNVLIVDDSVEMREKVSRVLNQTEYRPSKVTEAKDGHDAIQKLSQDPTIDLILSDWNMPNMDGFTFLKSVRRMDKKVVFLMVTKEAALGKIESALNEGADGYLVKPVNFNDLQRQLASAFRRVSKRSKSIER